MVVIDVNPALEDKFVVVTVSDSVKFPTVVGETATEVVPEPDVLAEVSTSVAL
ncbi:MAG TPA: hypothetical protein VFF52_28730 [Isosphaeraceae bacterium]|nr:hypothetical protein [Isosphaeraceae bacterium]